MAGEITSAGQDFLIEAGRVLRKPGVKEGSPVRVRELRAIIESLGIWLTQLGEDQACLEKQIAEAKRQSDQILAVNQEILDRLRILDA